MAFLEPKPCEIVTYRDSDMPTRMVVRSIRAKSSATYRTDASSHQVQPKVVIHSYKKVANAEGKKLKLNIKEKGAAKKGNRVFTTLDMVVADERQGT
jgi:hypothetical protein